MKETLSSKGRGTPVLSSLETLFSYFSFTQLSRWHPVFPYCVAVSCLLTPSTKDADEPGNWDHYNYQAKQVPGASPIPRHKIGDLGPLLDDAIKVPYYSDNASHRFLEVFRNHFLKAFYDAIRHDEAFIPDLMVINNATAGLEHLLRVTFP